MSEPNSDKDLVIPEGTTELYVAFDPGHTTGFMLAAFVPTSQAIVVLDSTPLKLNERYPNINMDSPPIVCYADLFEVIAAKYELLMDIAKERNLKVHTAIEDFVGGAGGNIQNTVNKIIGIISAAVFDKNHFCADVTMPKIFKNSTRLSFLPAMQRFAQTAEHKGMSKHSVDAGAHLLHRVAQEHSDVFKTLTIV